MWAAFQEPTLIRHGFAVPPSPLEGEGLRAVRCAAPTAGDGPGALVRKRQAQKWNRTSPNFSSAQAASGAGRDRTQALLILRAGRILPAPRGNPRNGGPGKGDYEHGSAHRSRPRWRFAYFAAMGKVGRRPQAAKLPLVRKSFFAPPSVV